MGLLFGWDWLWVALLLECLMTVLPSELMCGLLVSVSVVGGRLCPPSLLHKRDGAFLGASCPALVLVDVALNSC